MKYFLQILNKEPQEVTYSEYMEVYKRRMGNRFKDNRDCPSSFSSHCISGYTEKTTTWEQDKIFVSNFIQNEIDKVAGEEVPDGLLRVRRRPEL